jgi:hypothetical protein
MPVQAPEYCQVAKKDSRKPSEPAARYEIRVEPDWIARVQRQAERLGISAAAYIRQATTRQLEADEATDPDQSNS